MFIYTPLLSTFTFFTTNTAVTITVMMMKITRIAGTTTVTTDNEAISVKKGRHV